MPGKSKEPQRDKVLHDIENERFYLRTRNDLRVGGGRPLGMYDGSKEDKREARDIVRGLNELDEGEREYLSPNDEKAYEKKGRNSYRYSSYRSDSEPDEGKLRRDRQADAQEAQLNDSAPSGMAPLFVDSRERRRRRIGPIPPEGYTVDEKAYDRTTDATGVNAQQRYDDATNKRREEGDDLRETGESMPYDERINRYQSATAARYAEVREGQGNPSPRARELWEQANANRRSKAYEDFNKEADRIAHENNAINAQAQAQNRMTTDQEHARVLANNARATELANERHRSSRAQMQFNRDNPKSLIPSSPFFGRKRLEIKSIRPSPFGRKSSYTPHGRQYHEREHLEYTDPILRGMNREIQHIIHENRHDQYEYDHPNEHPRPPGYFDGRAQQRINDTEVNRNAYEDYLSEIEGKTYLQKARPQKAMGPQDETNPNDYRNYLDRRQRRIDRAEARHSEMMEFWPGTMEAIDEERRLDEANERTERKRDRSNRRYAQEEQRRQQEGKSD